MWEEFLESLSAQLYTLPSLLLSIILGFSIGFERRKRSKEAGVRTHTIVCVGSALMTIISRYIGTGDPGRIAAQIVTGIGFLGAGMIVYKHHEVRGLTTAAGIWATAGVGMACGAELYLIAVVATILMLVVQFVLRHGKFRTNRMHSVKIMFLFTGDENKKIKEIFGTDRLNHLVITRQDEKIIFSAILNMETEFSSTYLNDILIHNPFILNLERCEDE